MSITFPVYLRDDFYSDLDPHLAYLIEQLTLYPRLYSTFRFTTEYLGDCARLNGILDPKLFISIELNSSQGMILLGCSGNHPISFTQNGPEQVLNPGETTYLFHEEFTLSWTCFTDDNDHGPVTVTLKVTPMKARGQKVGDKLIVEYSYK